MLWLWLVSLAWAADITVEQRAVTVEELEALANQQAWSELVFLAKDVPAAERNKSWEALVEKGALGHLELLAQEPGSDLDGVAAQLNEEYPSLQGSGPYQARRLEVSLEALRRCYDNPFIEDECGMRLLQLARRDSQDPLVVKAAAKVVAEKESPAAASPFLPLALRKGDKGAVCKDPLWGSILKAGLGSSQESYSAPAAEAAAGDCWGVVQTSLMQEFDRSPSSLRGACGVFKQKGLLKGERAKKCSGLENQSDAQGPKAGR